MPNWADVVYWGLVQVCGAAAGGAAEPPDAEGTLEEAGPPAAGEAGGEAEGEADGECVGLAVAGPEVCGMAAVCGAAATSGSASGAEAEATAECGMRVSAPVPVAAPHPARTTLPIAMGRTLLTTRPGIGNCLRLVAL